MNILSRVINALEQMAKEEKRQEQFIEKEKVQEHDLEL